MKTDHNKFYSTLQSILRAELPGERAQLEMAPEAGTGRTKAFKQNSNPKLSAVCIALYPKNGEWYFPLIQRPTYNGAHSGQISLPGGKKEPEDNTMAETAMRETWEEVGIPVQDLMIAGELTPVYIPPSGFLVNTFIATLTKRPKFVPEIKEVVEILETPLSELLNPKRIKTTPMTFQKGKITMETPYFDLHDKIVWGATAMILSEFKAIIQSINRK